MYRLAWNKPIVKIKLVIFGNFKEYPYNAIYLTDRYWPYLLFLCSEGETSCTEALPVVSVFRRGDIVYGGVTCWPCVQKGRHRVRRRWQTGTGTRSGGRCGSSSPPPAPSSQQTPDNKPQYGNARAKNGQVISLPLMPDWKPWFRYCA